MKNLLRPAISLFIILTLITGVIYPIVTAAIGKVAFSDEADGSLIIQKHQLVGSALIGQNFTDPKFFWGRLSASSPQAYNGLNSTGSNFGPSNPALKAAVADRLKALHDADPDNKQLVPVDLVTASGSGLDPEISPAAAVYQVTRVAKARNVKPEVLMQLIEKNTLRPQFGIFGEARVNVLKLNLALLDLPN